MEYEKVYAFEPEDTRPAKRRRIEPQGLHASWKVREGLYEAAWKEQKGRIDSNLSTINQITVNDIFRYIDGAESAPGEIPTAFISSGAEGSSVSSVIGQLAKYFNKTKNRKLVSISPSDGTNLKALIKAVIRKTTSRDEGVDEDDDRAVSIAGKINSRLLNYDLQILVNHVKFHKIQQVAISIQDTEAFDSELLSDFIELLGYYQGRIPLVLIFSVATSIDFLQQRLSRKAVQTLNGRLFDVASLADEVEQVFEALIDDDSRIWIGPTLMSMLFERQNDYIQSIDTLIDEVQYAYMSCYYANALTIFLDKSVDWTKIPKDHFAAVRNLPSFRAWFIKELRPDNGFQGLKDILEDDALLRDVVYHNVEANRDAMVNMTVSLQLTREIQRLASGAQETSKSKLYVQAMSNKLNASSLIRSLLLAIRKAPSNIMGQVMDAIVQSALPSPFSYKFKQIRMELREITDAQQEGQQPLRSEDDVKNSTLRTTVVAQKVELSKQKATLSKEDAAYTALLRRFTDLLEQYFNTVLIDPKSLLFHEVFIYDLKSPHREVFTPRPRNAIERALAAPHDYLDCECCAPGNDGEDEQTLSASQPATAVLYQLYLESGSLINVSDLRQAFQAVMGDEKTEEQNMALFQRALAEMRYLGLMKNTRKRVDHVAKVAWRGL